MRIVPARPALRLSDVGVSRGAHRLHVRCIRIDHEALDGDTVAIRVSARVEVVEGDECACDRDGLLRRRARERKSELYKREIAAPVQVRRAQAWGEQVDGAKEAVSSGLRVPLPSLTLHSVDVRIPCAVLGLVGDAQPHRAGLRGGGDVHDEEVAPRARVARALGALRAVAVATSTCPTEVGARKQRVVELQQRERLARQTAGLHADRRDVSACNWA